MPRYRNDSTSNVTYKQKNGLSGQLAPGQAEDTFFFSSDPRLTKLSDAPLFPRTPGIERVGATAQGGEAIISPDCDYIIVDQITGQIDVYADDKNDPGQQLFKARRRENFVIPVPCHSTIGKLIIIGSGDCTVMDSGG